MADVRGKVTIASTQIIEAEVRTYIFDSWRLMALVLKIVCAGRSHAVLQGSDKPL